MSKNIVIVDVEGGPHAGPGMMREFGAVLFDAPPFGTRFHADLSGECGDPEDGEVAPTRECPLCLHDAMSGFDSWLAANVPGRPVFWSDNPAYDWQHVNWAFHAALGRNPFGHSARRISDFYAGVKRNPRKTQEWKRWRKTKHDHNPVNDALGNCEALWEILVRMADGRL